MSYRTLEHTGDLAVEATASSLAELFGECLRALTDCLTRLDRVRHGESRELAIVAPELDQLLVDFLNEVIYRYETEGLVFSDAQLAVSEIDQGWSLSGSLGGEAFDLSRHGLKTLIKAATYHQLSVRSRPEGWIARIVFDI